MEPNDLYGLPLERFIEERNALAKQLRRDDRRDEAAAVAKLGKPSLTAWAVNQLVRTQGREMADLFAAGDALQNAQADLLAGRGDPASLRQAVEAERAGVDQLTEKARGLLSANGHQLTPERIEQVSETLHAAALDEQARAQVRDGSLLRELRHVGLGTMTADSIPSPEARRARPATSRGSRPAPADRSASRDRAGRAEARKAEEQARRQIERADREVRAAEQRRDRAASELREAEEALSNARALAQQASEQHQQAKRTLEDA